MSCKKPRSIQVATSHVLYTVQAGDKLSDLAKKAHEPEAEIAKRNGLAPNAPLKPGRAIVINDPILHCEMWKEGVQSIVNGWFSSWDRAYSDCVWEAKSFKPLRTYTVRMAPRTVIVCAEDEVQKKPPAAAAEE